MDLDGAVLYHCGPVMLKQGERWVVKATGPTTSLNPAGAFSHRTSSKLYAGNVVRRLSSTGPPTVKW